MVSDGTLSYLIITLTSLPVLPTISGFILELIQQLRYYVVKNLIPQTFKQLQDSKDLHPLEVALFNSWLYVAH